MGKRSDMVTFDQAISSGSVVIRNNVVTNGTSSSFAHVWAPSPNRGVGVAYTQKANTVMRLRWADERMPNAYMCLDRNGGVAVIRLRCGGAGGHYPILGLATSGSVTYGDLRRYLSDRLIDTFFVAGLSDGRPFRMHGGEYGVCPGVLRPSDQEFRDQLVRERLAVVAERRSRQCVSVRVDHDPEPDEW